ncbi:hypothetical protein [Fuerstiella marisgermanici]|uniref:hypothetical protein n=1 Tax=Fuerstiella marisgermanici TaxID=1891926 RepID=UPI00097C1722|nr:hypothetical protein [Fuerstiella marisgermanici]
MFQLIWEFSHLDIDGSNQTFEWFVVNHFEVKRLRRHVVFFVDEEYNGIIQREGQVTCDDRRTT